MEIGFTAPRTTIGSPFEMPPVSPPARFVRCVQRDSPMPSMMSCTSDPKPSRLLEPEPELDPLDGVDRADRPRQPTVQAAVPVDVAPEPDGDPGDDHLEHATDRVAVRPGLVDPRDHRRLAGGIGAAKRAPLGLLARPRRPGGSIAAPPTSAVKLHASTPSSWRNARQTAPAATRIAVSRALARSSTLRTSSKPYFSAPARSACPGGPA